MRHMILSAEVFGDSGDNERFSHSVAVPLGDGVSLNLLSEIAGAVARVVACDVGSVGRKLAEARVTELVDGLVSGKVAFLPEGG